MKPCFKDSTDWDSPLGYKQVTVNGERFAGLNFRGFRGFQEHHESFSVNKSAALK